MGMGTLGRMMTCQGLELQRKKGPPMMLYLLRKGPQLLHEPLPLHWPCAIGLSHFSHPHAPFFRGGGGASTLHRGHLSVHVCVQVDVCTYWLLILLRGRELNSEPGTCSRARVLPCPSTWSTQALVHGLSPLCSVSAQARRGVSVLFLHSLWGRQKPHETCGPTQLRAA